MPRRCHSPTVPNSSWKSAWWTEISELLVLLPRFTGNNLRGIPRGSRKKPNAGMSPTCRLWTVDANSHMSFHAHAALCHDLERSLSERHGRGMAWERHGRCMACVNQTRPHCVNQMGKTQSKPLAERHGMCELALTQHGRSCLGNAIVDRHQRNPTVRIGGAPGEIWTVLSPNTSPELTTTTSSWVSYCEVQNCYLRRFVQTACFQGCSVRKHTQQIINHIC
jgi:hypothetical protein